MKCLRRAMELPELHPRHICADNLEGLIHVVPTFGARDDAAKYCIGDFAIDLYSGLLRDRQDRYPRLCWKSVFLPPHDEVKLLHFSTCMQTLPHERMSP